MADTAETQIEIAADVPVVAEPEVLAEAAPVAETAPVAEAAPVAEVIAAPAAEPEVRKARKPAAAKVAKVAAIKTVKVPAAKAPAAKAAAAVKVTQPAKIKPAKIKVAASKAAAPKTKTAPKAAKIAKPKLPTFAQFKETFMATKTPDFSAAITDAVAEAQEKAKVAFEKGTATVGEVNEFAKGNVEALVESGKILATGLKEMGSMLVTEGKAAIETVTADVKELSALKSPTDLFKLQGEIMRRNFDAMVAFGSKQTEAMMKLAGDAAAPVSNRVSVAVDKVKKAA